nr:MAG TPA: hypothetical protein [Caudoviricetes sp.]
MRIINSVKHCIIIFDVVLYCCSKNRISHITNQIGK